jgi:hypothetical protein
MGFLSSLDFCNVLMYTSYSIPCSESVGLSDKFLTVSSLSVSVEPGAKPHESQFTIFLVTVHHLSCLTIDLSVSVFLSHRFFSAWLATKNVGGAPSDGDESPPRLTEVARGKRKKTSTKKRKRQLTEVEVAQAVANTADRAE